MPSELIPHGLCHCGCGGKAPIALKTWAAKGWVKGQPMKFINGHSRRQSPEPYLVDPDTGCHNWARATQNKGYGLVFDPRSKRMVLAHRYYYELEYGPIPAGMQLDHLCRNRLCVNPAHLEVVTHAENKRRGKDVRLSHADRELIRSSPLSGRKLAKQLGVSHETVNGIRRGQYWRDEDGTS